ncbi:MAG: ABC transporter ATP-binding protein [Desulfatibacillaceae bacterium]
MLEARDVRFGYGNGVVLQGVSLCVAREELVSVIGPNGAGKSTLLKCLLHIMAPRDGAVTVDGVDVGRMRGRDRSLKMAYVPQALPSRFPMCVFDTVLMGRRPHLAWRPSARDVEKVSSAIDRMGLAHLAERDFDTLSGGQKQKVMLARALVQEADFLLLDEPTSNLDLRHQMEVMNLLRETVKEDGKGVLVAIHNLNTASRYSDRIVMLEKGVVQSCGPPSEVLCVENIERVYGVVAQTARLNGSQVVVPVRIT